MEIIRNQFLTLVLASEALSSVTSWNNSSNQSHASKFRGNPPYILFNVIHFFKNILYLWMFNQSYACLNHSCN